MEPFTRNPSTIDYDDGKLNISISCISPAAMHSTLMHSILRTIKYTLSCPDKTEDFAEEVIPLIDLMETMLPTERQLKKAYRSV